MIQQQNVVLASKAAEIRAELQRHDVDIADRTIRLHGGTVRALRERHDLEPVEGIGALLRY